MTSSWVCASPLLLSYIAVIRCENSAWLSCPWFSAFFRSVYQRVIVSKETWPLSIWSRMWVTRWFSCSSSCEEWSCWWSCLVSDSLELPPLFPCPPPFSAEVGTFLSAWLKIENLWFCLLLEPGKNYSIKTLSQQNRWIAWMHSKYCLTT